MATFKRLERLDIDHRGPLTGAYGFTTGEFFLGADLRTYSRGEALHAYLVEKGYRPVIFFDPEANGGIYSYSEQHLREFIDPGAAPDPAPSGGCILEGLETPFGPMTEDLDVSTPSGGSAPSPSAHPGIIRFSPGRHSREFFKLKSSPEPFPMVQAYTKRFPERKLAFVFENPGSVTVQDPLQTASLVENMKKYFSVDRYGVRIIVIYPEKDLRQLIGAFSREVPGNAVFYSHTMAIEMGLAAKDNFSGGGGGDVSKDELETFRRNMFYLGTPESDEITRLLASKRHSDPSFRMDGKTYDGIVKALLSGNFKVTRDGKKDFATEEDRTVSALSGMDLTALIKGIDTGAAREKLLSMKGQEKATEAILRFNRNRMRYRLALEKGQKKARKRMHKIYLGPPGTGKTTVAFLDAQDMRDIGLLSKGHCIPATVGDLEGEFVGQTRVKTQALCDKASGGVLLLDEAYGLFQDEMKGPSGSNIYGKEAIEVLIQNMENNPDLAIVFLGYEDDMKGMMKGNRGLPSRINSDGYIRFEPYSPEILFDIAVAQLPTERTPKFDETLRTVLKLEYGQRNIVTWGNAREAEQIAGEISDLYEDEGGEGPLEVRHIPGERLRLVDAENRSEEEIFAPLEGIVGLSSVKSEIRKLARRFNANLIRSRAKGESSIFLEPISLIFRGKPGTGKTTVARKMGQVFSAMGILHPGELKVVASEQLVSEIHGRTGEKIEKMIEDNNGNVIFVDEAYKLSRYPEAIDKLTELLTDDKYLGKYAIILAGYTDDMNRLLAMNQGLASRFKKGIIDFPDYSVDELWEIFLLKIAERHFSFTDPSAAEHRAKEWLGSLPDTPDYANGRKCELLMTEMENNLLERLRREGVRVWTPEILNLFHPEDIPSPMGGPAPSPAKRTASPSPGKFICDLSREGEENRVGAVSDLSKAVGIVGTSSGKGTGFVISEGERLIMTCYHVVDGQNNLTFRLNALGGKDCPCEVVWSDRAHDVAILRAESLPEGVMRLSLRTGEKETVPPLTPIIVCGYPLGENISRNLMINSGEVNNHEKGKRNADGTSYDVYFSSIPATYGNSGGPALLQGSFEVFGLLQGGLKSEGNFGVRIISDLSPIFGPSSLDIVGG